MASIAEQQDQEGGAALAPPDEIGSYNTRYYMGFWWRNVGIDPRAQITRATLLMYVSSAAGAARGWERREVAPIVQEIVNRPDWKAGNDLALADVYAAGDAFNSSDYMRAYEYEYDPTLAVVLDVVFNGSPDQ